MMVGCLALRERLRIYKQQLANMEAQQKKVRRGVEGVLLQPDATGRVYSREND